MKKGEQSSLKKIIQRKLYYSVSKVDRRVHFFLSNGINEPHKLGRNSRRVDLTSEKCSIISERLVVAGYFSILNYYKSLHICG
jgi:hypothetical protein